MILSRRIKKMTWHAAVASMSHHGMIHDTLANCERFPSQAMADLSMGALTTGYWPNAGSLLLLKLLVQVFPCTDFRYVRRSLICMPSTIILR